MWLRNPKAAKFHALGLTVLVINHQTLEDARKSRQPSLWIRARQHVSIIILSPEMLASKGFEKLIQHADFSARECGLGVDEIHLLETWGAGFRKAFWQIGHVRARLPTRTVLIGLTATLAAGPSTENVFKFLGIRPGEFHLIQRSNQRPDLRVIYRTLSMGLGGWTFPDLRHILRSGRRTIIYCDTISLTFRLATYLISTAPRSSSPLNRIRIYNALNWPDYNAESRRLFDENRGVQILIATNSLMVGVDLRCVDDVYILGAPRHPDEEKQKGGRAGRDANLVKDPRCIVYFGKKDRITARAVIDGKKVGGKTRPGVAVMKLETARLLLADCRTVHLDTLYNNPPTDPPCTCDKCATAPPPPPLRCISSCCIPEDVQPYVPGLKQKKMNPVKKTDRLTRPMRAIGLKRLQDLRWKIYCGEDLSKTAFFPPELFLPNDVIKGILDRFALITDFASLDSLIGTHTYAKPHQMKLYILVIELRALFAEMHAEKRKKGMHIELNVDGCESGSEGNGGDSGGEAARHAEAEINEPPIHSRHDSQSESPSRPHDLRLRRCKCRPLPILVLLRPLRWCHLHRPPF